MAVVQGVEKARLKAIFSDEDWRYVCGKAANSPPAWQSQAIRFYLEGLRPLQTTLKWGLSTT